MKTLLEHTEPALSFVREELLCMAHADTAPIVEGHEALSAIRAARDYLILHRAPAYVVYDPRQALDYLTEEHAPRRHVLLNPVAECAGDTEQIRCVVNTLLRNVVLESDALLAVELTQEEEVPQLRLCFDGPGRFPEVFSIGGILEATFEILSSRWTAITRGGRIDRTPYGLSLRLKGVRVMPDSKAGLDVHAATLKSVEERLATLTLLEPSLEHRHELRRAVAEIERVIAALEAAERPSEPTNLCAVVQDVKGDLDAQLKQAGVALEVWCDPKLPPIVARRERMRAFFMAALQWAASLPSSASASLLIDYDAKSRVAGLVLSLDGLREPVRDNARLASMRRAIAEAHGGELKVESTESNTTVTATLPDPVGRRLDAWIPGWDAFSDRSRQVLRLLKSGGPTPPEAFLLEGVLEEELERWLLPKLEEPAAVNLAHELPSGNSELPGSSRDRMEKALGQIRKRKPRKEIVRPAYAAEILWAYRDDARSRAAVGAENLQEPELRTLCEALLRRPPDYVVALRLVSQALGHEK